jgi:hypothetical protein
LDDCRSSGALDSLLIVADKLALLTVRFFLISSKTGARISLHSACPCDCAYKKRLDYWASQGVPNHTMAEWREILAPVLDEIKKNLTVNKANLS